MVFLTPLAFCTPFTSFIPNQTLTHRNKTIHRNLSFPATPRITRCQTSPVTQIDPSSTDTLLHTLETTPPTSTTVAQIIHHLADSRGMARLALVTHLGDMGPICIPPLIKALQKNPNPVVRRSCAKAIAKIGDDSATSALVHALVHDQDTVTRSSAAGALAKMGEGAIDDLIAVIANDSVSMTAKGHAAWAMSFMQSGSEALADMLHHPQPAVRMAIVGALGGIAIGDALPVMGGLAEDDWDDTPEEGEAKTRAVNALVIALDDSDPGVKAEATTALANAGVRGAAAKVAQFLDDEDHELRRCAALSMMKFGDVTMIDVLRERQNDEDEVREVRNVSKLAADYLEKLSQQPDDWE